MAKLTYLLGLLILCIGLVASSSREGQQYPSLSKHIDDTIKDNGGMDEYRARLEESFPRADAKQDNDDDEDLYSEQPSRDPRLDDTNKALKNFMEMLTQQEKRNSLKSIVNKIKELILETREKGMLHNIMRNMNSIMNQPDNLELAEALVTGWASVFQGEGNLGLINQIQGLHSLILENEDIMATLNIAKEALSALHEDLQASNLIYAIARSAKVFIEKKNSYAGIFYEALAIAEPDSEVKVNYFNEIITRMPKIMKNWNIFVGNDDRQSNQSNFASLSNAQNGRLNRELSRNNNGNFGQQQRQQPYPQQQYR